MKKFDQEQRIKIKGLGGQGVQFVAVILAKILQDEGYFASCYFIYDAAMRGGKIMAELAFSPRPNPCPIGSNFDYLVVLQGAEADPTPSPCQIEAPNNMVALGKILKEFEFEWDEAKIKTYLPERFIDQNISNIHKGFSES